MQHCRFGLWSALCILGMSALLTGCQGKKDKLVYENFTRVQERLSTQADVTLTLGEPDHVLGDRWMYERPDKHLFAYIDFDQGGRVARKQWIDARAPVWEDSHDPGATPKP